MGGVWSSRGGGLLLQLKTENVFPSRMAHEAPKDWRRRHWRKAFGRGGGGGGGGRGVPPPQKNLYSNASLPPLSPH